MAIVELKRGEDIVKINGDLLLAPNQQNIKPFRMMCKEFGAVATFSKPITAKKDIDFDENDTPLFAVIQANKFLADLEKNMAVSAIVLDMGTIDNETYKKIVSKTTKPLIGMFNYKADMQDMDKREFSALFIQFRDEDKDITLNHKLLEKIKSIMQIPVFAQAHFDTPEDIHSILKKTEADMAVIGDLAINQPVIFEQAINYFEKGYYNKITRKRREKEVSLLEECWAKYGGECDLSEKQRLIDLFMEE